MRGSNVRLGIARGLAILLLGWLLRFCLTPPIGPAPPDTRLRVAVLCFQDRTGDPDAGHWRYTCASLLSGAIEQVKTIRVLPESATHYAFRQVGRRPGSALTPELARSMGEYVEAARVVWGTYRREGRNWRVVARVVNAATGKASGELAVAAPDWYQVRDRLAERVLRELGITPTAAERARMARRATSSPAALEWYSKASGVDLTHGTLAKEEEYARQAIAADPRYSTACTGLAATLGTEGRLAEAKEAARQAVRLDPKSVVARRVLAWVLGKEGHVAEQEQELREARRLAPEDAGVAEQLAWLLHVKGRGDEAVAALTDAAKVDPWDAGIHAQLAHCLAERYERESALRQLREAVRVACDDINAEQMICRTYDRLGEIPLALAHYEKCLALMRARSLPSDRVYPFEKRAQELRATLVPRYVRAVMPTAYTAEMLQAELKKRLAPEERRWVIFPLESSPAIKRWAQDVTRGADSDLRKARRLYEALIRKLPGEGGGGTRTAREAYAAWHQPRETVNCQEYTKLFIAMARDVGVRAFYVHLERDYEGRVVYHDCAAVFHHGRALLVDPAYRWFGVPHKQYVFLDDLQVIAHQLFQSDRKGQALARCRVAAKLHPNFAWGLVRVGNALADAGRPGEARQALAAALKLEPSRWDAYLLQGQLAQNDKQPGEAIASLRKGVALAPDSDSAHFRLAEALRKQGDLNGATGEYREVLRCAPDGAAAEQARRALAQIAEHPGDPR